MVMEERFLVDEVDDILGKIAVAASSFEFKCRLLAEDAVTEVP